MFDDIISNIDENEKSERKRPRSFSSLLEGLEEEDAKDIKEDTKMSLTINTNPAAVSAGFHLSRNSSSLQESINRLSSGKRINKPSDDAGGLSVSMKLRSSINRLNGASNNIQNGVSFLEVQDGILEAAGRIVDRMIELKGMKPGHDEERLR